LLDDRRPQGESEFSWTKQWYCVGITEDFDQVRPNSVTLLNTDLVIWFSSSDNSWHCFQDRCPHRAASLSEGKVWEDGTLHCSYHGWRFRGNGTCTVIPQAASDEAETKACSKPGACAKTYSIKDLQGKLFVWAEPGAAAAAEAARTPLPIDELQAEAESKGTKLLQAMPTYARILPYDYQTLIENLIDPAHVPIAHHGKQKHSVPHGHTSSSSFFDIFFLFKLIFLGVAGNRNNVKHGNEESRREETKPGTVFSVSRRAATSLVFDRNAPLYLEMHPPSMVLYYQRKPDGTFFSFPAWCTPISPGKSLLVTHQTTDYDTVPLFLRIITKLPRWADHVFLRLKVVDGDNALLVHQERLQIKEDKSAPEGSPPAWRRLFFMPTSSDVSIVAFRTWLDGTAKGGPFGPLHRIIDYPPKPVRMQILDRLSSHTEKCSSCRTASSTPYIKDIMSSMYLYTIFIVGSLYAGLQEGRAASGCSTKSFQSSLGSCLCASPLQESCFACRCRCQLCLFPVLCCEGFKVAERQFRVRRLSPCRH